MLRVYLAGEVQVEHGGRLLRESQLPSRQGRLAFAYLAAERERAVSQSELADLLWPDGVPTAWTVALSAIASKLRSRLAGVGLSRSEVIAQAFGCYQLRLPPGAWVDLEAAAGALHQAEGALLANDAQAAYGPALIATVISRRPFLVGEESPWVEGRRAELADVLVRALDCLSRASAANGEPELALAHAREVVRLEPFRESGYRLLMDLLRSRGERAEAVRVYEQCRSILAEELGVSPSAETAALHRQLLG
jgi:SARP family transcriptional regulator, regulator of embCAB operon